MNKKVELEQLMPLIREKINSGGTVAFTPMGNSMFPTLYNGADSVILTKPIFPLKKYDIVLYQRKTGSYIMHRVISVKDGEYVMRGDNQIVKEYGIKEYQIIAVVKEYVHRKKHINMERKIVKLYGAYITKSAHVRKCYYKIRHFFGRIKRKLIGEKIGK